jgi:two-component system NarL family response regulator
VIDVLLTGSAGLDRRGVAHVLEESPEIGRVWLDGLETSLADLVADRKPDIVVLYLRFASEFEPEVIRAIKARVPSARVLILSSRTDRQYVIELLNAGADGHVSLRMGPDELLEAVRVLGSGSRYVCPKCRDPSIEEALGDSSGRSWPEPLEQLSEREREVMGLLRNGHSTSAIAEELSISIRTVEKHIQHIREKLGLDDQRELLRYLLARDIRTGREES